MSCNNRQFLDRNVSLSREYPQQACLCSYHDNIHFLCDSPSKSKSDFPTHSEKFVDCFVCIPDSEVGMLGQSGNATVASVPEEDLRLMVA